MKDKIIKYYVPVFGFVLSMSLVSFFINYKSENKINVLVALLIVIVVLTAIFGTLNYRYGEKLKINYKKKKLKKRLFQEFETIGFINCTNFLQGVIDNYSVVIFPDSELFPSKKWIEVHVFFNPKQGSSFIPEYIFDRMMKINKGTYFWHSNMLIIKKQYGLKMPKFDKVLSLIKEGTQLLKANNISEIRIKEWKTITQENETFYRQKEGLYK